MTRMWIVVGDATSSGGRVITGSQATDIDGKPVSRVSDKATCPLHKGVFPIADGDPTTIIDGQPVALHGSKLACGCTVLAVQQVQVFVDSGGGGSALAGSSRGTPAFVAAAANRVGRYDEAFVLISELTNEPLSGRPYKIVRKDGAIEDGVTDEEGRTHLVQSEAPEVLHVEIAEEAVHE